MIALVTVFPKEDGQRGNEDTDNDLVKDLTASERK